MNGEKDATEHGKPKNVLTVPLRFLELAGDVVMVKPREIFKLLRQLFLQDPRELLM